MTCYQPSSAEKKLIISKKKYMIEIFLDVTIAVLALRRKYKKNYKEDTSPMEKNIFLQKLATRLPISEHSCQASVPSWNII